MVISKNLPSKPPPASQLSTKKTRKICIKPINKYYKLLRKTRTNTLRINKRNSFLKTIVIKRINPRANKIIQETNNKKITNKNS